MPDHIMTLGQRIEAERRQARIDHARRALEALQSGEWDDVMLPFCRHCGSSDTGCQCWNDE